MESPKSLPKLQLSKNNVLYKIHNDDSTRVHDLFVNRMPIYKKEIFESISYYKLK